MADDNRPQTPQAPQKNIDDLVKELSRAQAAPSEPPSNISRPPAVPSIGGPSILPPKLPTSVLNPIPKPSVTIPPPMNKPVTPPAMPPKEYQSNIRTMGDDLSKLKSGQQPQGMTVPRKIEETKPAMPPSAMGPKPSVPPPPVGGPRISMPVPTPSQNLKPLPSVPKVPIPPVPMPKPALPESKAGFVVPDAGTKAGSGSGRRMIILIGAVVLVIILGAAYWYFMAREPAGVVISPTPFFTPRPSQTPIDVLQRVFPAHDGAITLPASGDPSAAFSAALSAQPGNPGVLETVTVSNTNSSGSAQTLDAFGLLDQFLINYPSSLRPAAAKSVILAHGQQENFDAKGKALAGSISRRLVLVSEAASGSVTSFKVWEGAMTDDLAGLFGYDKAKNTGSFKDNAYLGTAIRYKNFIYPDRSIDYAVIHVGDKDYLIIAGSREAMFATIDAFNMLGK